jgi:hypothetical protein
MAAQQHLPSYDGDGPVVSVYLSLSESSTGYGGEIGLRWRALREQLVERGVDDAQLAPLDARVAAAAPCPRTLAAFVRGGRLEEQEMEEFGGPDDADVAAVGPLPLAVPLLRWRAQWVPYVTVLTDRTGADLAAFRGAGAAVATETVVGPDDEVERNAPGGWQGLAQPRYQHRAEDSWAHNAAEVSDHVVKMVGEVEARLVLVAGDVRAVQELTDRLPEQVRHLTEHVTAGLEQGQGRVRMLPATVSTKVHEAAARRRTKAVEELEEAVGNKHLATGEEACAEALRRGAVARLVVEDRPADDRWAWVWPDDPQRIASSEAPVAEVPGAEQAPLREALVRAAFAQGGEVVVVGPEEADLPDGFGALLRY